MTTTAPTPFAIPSYPVKGADQATLDDLKAKNLVLLGQCHLIPCDIFIKKWNELNQIHKNPESFLALVRLAFNMSTNGLHRSVLKYRMVRLKYSPKISISFKPDYREILVSLVENHPITKKIHLFVPPQISEDEDEN